DSVKKHNIYRIYTEYADSRVVSAVDRFNVATLRADLIRPVRQLQNPARELRRRRAAVSGRVESRRQGVIAVQLFATVVSACLNRGIRIIRIMSCAAYRTRLSCVS